MKYKNDYTTPRVIELALSQNKHWKGGDYSVTQIIKEPIEIALSKRYGELITHDIKDTHNLLIGTAIHRLLEDAYKDEEDVELEMQMVANFNGIDISGTCDVYNTETKTVQDYKTCSVYKIIKEDFESWEKQLNIYAEILFHNGYEVKNLEVVAIIKDWDKKKQDDPNYPSSPYITIGIPLWDNDRREEEINKYIETVVIAESLEDGELEPCTDKWETPIKYKVIKDGAARALKVFDTLEEATALALEKGANVVTDGGEPRKCNDWCDLKGFCPWYQRYITGGI